MSERIGKDNFEEKVLKNPLPVLVDFYSDSCVPCKMISPILGDIEDEKEGALSVYKLNIQFDGEVAEKYSVKGTPTLILFRDGEVRERKTGAQTRKQLLEWVEGFLDNQGGGERTVP